MRIGFITLAAVLLPGLAAAETRCGWYANPTPANHYLTDADATWALSLQGGNAAPGFLDLPPESFDFGSEWMNVGADGYRRGTQDYYGYGCACFEGTFGDPGRPETIRISGLRPLPLSRCEADPALPSQ
jgi:hypothetical protein